MSERAGAVLRNRDPGGKVIRAIRTSPAFDGGSRCVVAARVVVNGLAVALVVLILPGVRAGTGHPALGYLVLGAILG